jgi:hypothetical protein
MIRYPTTEEELQAKTDQFVPTWTARARERTALFKTAKKFEDASPIWGEIKQIFMDLQAGKCGYCERKVGDASNDRILHDVEHFRPKSSVKRWPAKSMGESKHEYDFPTGSESSEGYFLLPYHLLNYLVACKKCNSVYKSDYFPIMGTRRFCRAAHPKELKEEQALLLYPIADIDDDPEDVITFQGIIAVPKNKKGIKHRRARVTIDFFELDVGREELLLERALMLKALFLAMEDLETAIKPWRRKAAEQTVALAVSESSAHTNCARAFVEVYKSNADLAAQYYEAVYDYLETKRH